MVTRSQTGPVADGVRRVALDASDAEALSDTAAEAVALFNCANPASYTSWDRVWLPLSASLLLAAERTRDTLLTASSLYGYGPVTQPMVEGMPDRATDHKGRLRDVGARQGSA